MNGELTKRKEKKNKGGSVFTCEKRKKAEFTTYKEFKKKRSRDWRDYIGKLTAIDRKLEWNQLEEEEKQLFTDPYENLRQANGSVTWRGLEERIDHIVSHETIRLHIKSIDDFTYRTGRILPMLDSQTKHRRVHWAKAFWVFWESVKAIKKKKANDVSSHG